MRALLYFFAFAVVIGFTACDNEEENNLTSYGSIDEFMAAHCLSVQNFTFNAQTGTTITGNNGLQITIPPNILVDANDQVVTGNVSIELVEALDFDDIVFSRRSNFKNQRPVQTNGQFMLNFKQGNNLLIVDSSFYYTVEIPRKDPAAIVNYFCVQEPHAIDPLINYQACKDYLDTLSWSERVVNSLSSSGNFYPVYGQNYYLYFGYTLPDTAYINPNNDNVYLMRVSQTGWVACNTYERYYMFVNKSNNNPSTRTFKMSVTANYPVELTREFYYQPQTVNTNLYLFADNKFISPINIRRNNENPFDFKYVTNYYTPPFKVIAFGVDATGGMHWGETTINSVPGSGEIDIDVLLNPASESQILNNLEALD